MRSSYGNFRQRKFTDIFPDVTTFENEYTANGIPQTITSESIKTVYYLLYANFGNSTIANSDENQFKYKLFSLIFMYGPTWEKKLEVQQTLRGLSEEEIMSGARQIVNHAFNPSTPPSTGATEELSTVDDQNVMKYKKSKLDAYSLLWSMLVTDVTREFIRKFEKLFLIVVQPELPLWYVSEEGEEE